jgi:hypothetical protein
MSNFTRFQKNSIFLGALAMACVSLAKDTLLDDFTGNLYSMRAVYRSQYAPASWKREFAGYDLEEQFQKALAAAQNNPQFSLADSRLILKDFIYSMKDYHTSISFVSTEAASLPFTVKSAGDKVFLVYIDRTKLSNEAFPFQVGDEVVTFGGKSTSEAIRELQNQIIENVPATDRSLAELRLTNRTAARGLSTPRGPITLGIRPQGEDQVKQIQLIWKYTPEQIGGRGDFGLSVKNSEAATPHALGGLFHPQMNVDLGGELADENRFNLGTRRSFTPALGTKVWESGADNSFDAYIYKTDDRRLVGYVRIASYVMPDYLKAVADFRKIIGLFQSTTDAMVIDQVNNPGGSVFYLYALASMLSDQPLRTPRHRMAVNQADVSEALGMIEKLQSVQNDADAARVLPTEELNGFPSSYEFAQFSLAYARYIVSEWAAGHKLTDPYWILGVDHINPDSTHYTKPILLLTNQLDFSGGDFFPAILQDNARVTILGTPTAGAGGYVNDVQIPNNIGVAAFRVTGSIAERVNGRPIENLGVKPDISYEMTEADYTKNFGSYVNAVRSAVTQLLQK